MSAKLLTVGKDWWKQEREPAKGKALVVQRARRKPASQAKMMSVKKAAEIMSCSIWKVYDRIKDKSLFAEWDGGGWRIPDYAIDDFYDFQRARKKA